MPTSALLPPSLQPELTLFRSAYNLELSRLRHQAHDSSISEAQDLLTSALHSRYDEHLWPSIKVTSRPSMPELRGIGRLSRKEGILACGRLVRAPVVHQQVAEGLWDFLAACQGRSEGEEGVDEQEEFERDVVARMREGEGDEEDKMDKGGSKGGSLFEGRKTRVLPTDALKRPDTGGQMGRLGGLFWQKEEMICPCQKTYEAASVKESSEDHGSETSAERWSPSASTVASSRSSLSQVFAWGRRSSNKDKKGLDI